MLILSSSLSLHLLHSQGWRSFAHSLLLAASLVQKLVAFSRPLVDSARMLLGTLGAPPPRPFLDPHERPSADQLGLRYSSSIAPLTVPRTAVFAQGILPVLLFPCLHLSPFMRLGAGEAPTVFQTRKSTLGWSDVAVFAATTGNDRPLIGMVLRAGLAPPTRHAAALSLALNTVTLQWPVWSAAGRVKNVRCARRQS